MELTDEQLAERYGDDWYERARWVCQCESRDKFWTVDDMYDNTGNPCPWCGVIPVVDTDYMDNLRLPF